MTSAEKITWESEPTDEDIKAFRLEITKLYEAETDGRSPTGHFTYPTQKGFDAKDLGVPEFKLWKAFKSCQAGERPYAECLEMFREHQKQSFLLLKEEKSTARAGLDSIIGNNLSGKE